jgi:ArsR family transcriptional regulator, arsenate/arsenite/antimonite-responsive transcriptional repressor
MSLISFDIRNVAMKNIDPMHLSTLKALADETRLKIINMLAYGSLCACDILESFNITQSTLSYHMKQLAGTGLVTAVRDGAWMHYSLDHKAYADFLTFMSDIGSATDGLGPIHSHACKQQTTCTR